MCTALGGALKRGMLGKSGHDYAKRFTGSDEYWDRAIAAQVACSQNQPPKPDSDRPIHQFGLWKTNHDKATRNTDTNGTQQARESHTAPLCGL
jgi:hypothetical protein